MSDISFTREQLGSYCCVDLIRAEADGHISTASGGVWLGSPVGDSSCLNGLPKAHYCPFCGATICVAYNGNHWSWHTEARDDD